MVLHYILICTLLVYVCSAAWPLQVQTDKGIIQGFSNKNNINHFYGVPYAQPPLGTLRWAPPQPHQPWSNVLMTTQYGNACLQPKNLTLGYTFPDNATFSEDCLNLNIFAPDTPNPNKAVMVWIHGGALLNGGNSELVYIGDHISQIGDVVVVVINYRLGVFGWLAHPDFVKDDPSYPSSGNYGLLDQRLALTWVRNNIRLFGGDPKNVTIMGESAGGSSVCFHMLSPKSQGLFAKAIIESGACYAEVGTIDDAQKYALNLQSQLKCTGNQSQVVQCMRAASAAVIEALQDVSSFHLAVVDGYEFVSHPYKTIKEGKYTAVPLIAGNVRDEGTLFIEQVKQPVSNETYQQMVMSVFAAFTPQVLAQYPCSAFNASDCWFAYAQVFGDSFLNCPTNAIANTLAVTGTTYSYVFTREPYWQLIHNPNYGAYHSCEIPFVFSTLADLYPFTPPEMDLAHRVTQFWTTFANSGNPNTPGMSLWPVYEAPNFSRNVLDLSLTITNNYKRKECAFWEVLYGLIYNY